MVKKIIFFFFALLSLLQSRSQGLSQYEKHWFVQNGDTLPYRLLLPENYDASKKYPVVFFLHGSGEKGNDNEKQLVHGAQLFLKEENRKRFPAIIVFPQCPANSSWSNVQVKMDNGKRVREFQEAGEPTKAMRLAQELLASIIKAYPVARKQIYVGGLSMGGMGTFEIVRRNPKLFAAAFPICGGGNVATASSLKKTTWWVFHGGKDDVVPPKLSEDMVEAIKKQKGTVKFTLYPNANHNSWDPAFAEPELLTWLFAQRK